MSVVLEPHAKDSRASAQLLGATGRPFGIFKTKWTVEEQETAASVVHDEEGRLTAADHIRCCSLVLDCITTACIHGGTNSSQGGAVLATYAEAANQLDCGDPT
jgi:hypothetical protein